MRFAFLLAMVLFAGEAGALWAGTEVDALPLLVQRNTRQAQKPPIPEPDTPQHNITGPVAIILIAIWAVAAIRRLRK